jgi:hypothetical protein
VRTVVLGVSSMPFARIAIRDDGSMKRHARSQVCGPSRHTKQPMHAGTHVKIGPLKAADTIACLRREPVAGRAELGGNRLGAHSFDTSRHQSTAKSVSVPESCGSMHHEPAITHAPDTGKGRDDGRERYRLSAPLSLRPRRLGDAALLKSPHRKGHRAATPRVTEALARLRAVFPGTAG